MEFTQLTQPGLTPPDESSNMTPINSSSHSPLSPPPIIPYGRLVPCVPSAELAAIDLLPTQESYWLGRSHKCDLTANYSSAENDKLSEKEQKVMEWGKSMISNRHCRIFQQQQGNQIFIEDNSGNGTFINQQTALQKGETRILHSGDEICLVSAETLRKKITSYRVVQMIVQQFSFIFVQSNPRKALVNPRAMNYHFGRNHVNSSSKKERRSSSDAETPPSRRIETFYDMREVLGDGTSGQVRRAIHRQSGEERAVKVISLRRQFDTSLMEREVQLLKSIDHPYIVKLVEVFVRPGVAMYLVMELVKGGDLFDSIVEKQRYTEVEARRAMRRLLSAVHYLHNESNIVHRDLKPENILCSSPTHVKLADFGLAKIVKADGLKTFCGTPAYFAPEVLQRRNTVAGEGRYGKPADMWSLGVILYILLTGKPPFDPDMEESSKPFQVEFESDGHIWSTMPSAKDLVANMLCLDPRRRFTVSQACNHSWTNVDDGDTHCHPLDDPAIGSKKSNSDQEPKANDSDAANADASVSTKDNTTRSSSLDSSCSSKLQILPSSPSEDRIKSVLHDVHTKLLEPRKSVASMPPPTSKIKTDKVETPKVDKGSPIDANSEAEDVNDDKDDQTKNETNDKPSPSDDSSSSSRSPLTKLDFNKRSNDFRNRIIEEAKGSPSSADSPEKSESPSTNGEQVAVTPTSSSVKAAREPSIEDKKEADEDMEDPILSQFSSVISSVESFSDSSVNDLAKSDQPYSDESESKRPLDDDKADDQAKSAKRAKTKNSVQTTLKSWFVKKD